MSLFKSMFGGEPQRPPIALRDTLFGDMPLDLWTGNGAKVFPWSAFATARTQHVNGNPEAAITTWKEIANCPGLEPRHYLQAWHFLRQAGVQPPAAMAKQLLGVVVEVGMSGGLDIVAAYPDHAARYYNFSGRSIIWEHPDNSLDDRIDALMAASARVVAQIGPWLQARPPAPPTEQVRLSFLTPSGLHFGQAHMDVLSKDPMGGPVLYLAGGLMQALIAKTQPNQSPN